MSTALLIVAGCTRSSASSDHEALGSTLNWPLGRSGNPRIGLRIPRAYAVLDDAAKAMNKAVYGESSPNEPGQVHQELILSATWPGLAPDLADIRDQLSVPGGGRIMVANILSAAVEDFQGKHYDALQTGFDTAVDWSTNNLCVTKMDLFEIGIRSEGHCYKRERSDIKAPEFELERWGVDFAKYPEMPEGSRSQLAADDIYFARSPDCSCSAGTVRPFSRACSQPNMAMNMVS